MHLATGITALPLEVIEDIIVFLAIEGHFTTISSLAQTCRHLRQFVYDPADKHLWHRIFLTTFDDPSTLIHVNGAQGVHQQFDWSEETRRRIRASAWLRPRPNEPEPDPRILKHHLRSVEQSPTSHRDYTEQLQIIVSVIETLAPLPRSSAPPSEDLLDPKGPFAQEMSLVEADARSPLAPPPIQGQWGKHISRSMLWLHFVLDKGLPLVLPCRFAHSRIDKPWLLSSESQALHKLVALCGIQVLLDAHPDGPVKGYNWRWKSKDRYQWPQLGNQGRKDLIKRLCQARVFQMDYPSERRCWGPFLPVETHLDEQTGSARVPVATTSSQSSEDGEYFPPTERREHEPPAEELHPDWVHLSAIRVVVESCLRADGVYHDIVTALTSRTALRPGFWVPSDTSGLHTPLTSTSPYERDWAGVEGIWQRCVVWLDYDNLVTQNYVEFGSNIEPIDEVVLIVPLTMRITGYSPATVPGYEYRPDIHFEGEMGGALWDLDQDTRRIHGTVSVIADGSVRWSTYSSPVGDPEDDEWASEGVQLGGVGSRCGVLGLWTGASHDQQGEPIGAWWQWRVV